MKNAKKLLALALAGAMVFGLAACGDSKTSTSTSTTTSTSTSTSTEVSTSVEQEPVKLEPLTISVLLGSTNTLHEEADENYDRLVAYINEYTNMDVQWQWIEYANIGSETNNRIAAGNFSDIMQVGNDAVFQKAALEGYFWDITDYIDDYDNLATIPAATRANISINGRIYALPRVRNLARNGFGYRADWCDNLGLFQDREYNQPQTIDEFYQMIYEFTYNDPDGNGVNDTYGLAIDSWSGVWNISNVWFGVPNTWGIDSNGDLIYYIMTDEWKTAMKTYRKWYQEGLIYQDYMSVGAGKARSELLNTSKCGSNFQVLDDQRKVETYFEGADVALADPDEPIYMLGGYLDGGYGPKCLPTTGYNGMVAISKQNIKTEEQLRQVLQFLNDLNDGDVLTAIDYGFEGVTYSIDEDGYIHVFSAEELPEGVSSTFHNGFNQVLPYYTADANARKNTVAPASTVVTILENKLYDEDIPYCVPNYGAGYTSATATEKGADLDAILFGTADELGAINKYIQGEIDDAGLDEMLNTWWTAGGEQMTKEMNAAYHAAGN